MRSASGTITQWIFQPVQCKCDIRPAPLGEEQLPGDEIISGAPYQFLGVAGVGGVGTVYKAVSRKLGKPVAIKAINPMLNSAFDSQKFELEAKLISKLQHPNVLSILDFGFMSDGRPYIVTEWIEGCTLAQHISKHGVLPPNAFEEVFGAVCDGLSHAHRRHIVHRDIKPGNIMLSRSSAGWTVKIIDFGTSKDTAHDQSTTRVEDVAFSPYYVSPERVNRAIVDQRADLYSLGCTMFEALTGRPPFIGKAMTVAMRHQTEAPPTLASVSSIEFPPHIERVIAKLLAKEPEARHQSAEEVKANLAERDKKPASEKSKQWLAFGIASVLAAGILGALMYIAVLAPTDRGTEETKTPSPVSIDSSVKLPHDFRESFWIDSARDGIPWKAILQGSSLDLENAPDVPEFAFLSVHVPYIPIDKLRALCQHKYLRGLSLTTELTPLHIEEITKAKNLEVLCIGDDIHSGDKQIAAKSFIKDADLERLTQLQRLRHLFLSGQYLTDNCMRSIARMPMLSHLHLDSLKGLKGTELGNLNSVKNLKNLCLKHTKLSDAGWRELSSLKYVGALNLCDTGLTNENMRYVAGLPLERLDISNNPLISDASVELLKSIATLKRLYVCNSGLSSDGVGKLAHLQKLVTRQDEISGPHGDAVFNFDGAPHSESTQLLQPSDELPKAKSTVFTSTLLTDVPAWIDLRWEFGRIWKLPVLSTIDDAELESAAIRPDFAYVSFIGHNQDSFSSQALLKLCQKPQLRGLAFADTNLSPEKLELVCTNARDLRTITIGDNPRLTDRDLAMLINLKQLRFLDMSRSDSFTDDSLDSVSQLEALEHLKMGGLKHFSGTKLTKLERLKNLITLSLNLNQLSNAGWKQLSTLKQISILNVDGTNLDDEKVQLLLKLPLERLSILGTRVTDKGFLALRGLRKTVRLIHASNLERVSKSAINRLKRELPNCAIEIGLLGSAHGDPLLTRPPTGKDPP